MSTHVRHRPSSECPTPAGRRLARLPTKQAQPRPSTYSSYAKNIELHVNPRTKHRSRHPLPAAAERREAERRRGGLATKTARTIRGIIRKALADAHRKVTVNRNVADLADPPKVRLDGRTAMKVWSAEELRTFLASIENHDLSTAFFLVANTGMRRGEVLGLTWRNVDLDAARLVVSQSGAVGGLRGERGRLEDCHEPHDRPRHPDRGDPASVAPAPARGAPVDRPP